MKTFARQFAASIGLHRLMPASDTNYFIMYIPRKHKYSGPNDTKVANTHYPAFLASLLIMLRIQLHLLLLNLTLQVVSNIFLFAGPGHKPRRMREHIVHFLKRHLLRLRQERVEKERIGEIANHKDEVEPVVDVLHGDWGDLANHRVKGERDACRDGDTLGSGAGVEDLGRDDPGERTASAREGEVVQPGHDDEAPVSAAVVAVGRELCEQDRGDDKGEAVAQVAADESPSSSEAVDEQDTKELRDQGDDGVDCLVAEGVGAGDTDLGVDVDRVVSEKWMVNRRSSWI